MVKDYKSYDYLKLNDLANKGDKTAQFYLLLNIGKENLMRIIFENNPLFKKTFSAKIEPFDLLQLSKFLAVQYIGGNFYMPKGSVIIEGEDATEMGQKVIEIFNAQKDIFKRPIDQALKYPIKPN